jgi:hypothetical protein
MASLRGKLTPAEVRKNIQQACSTHQYDPFLELVKLATEKQQIDVKGVGVVEVHVLDADQRIVIAKEIASYLAPKLKNVEVDSKVSGEIKIVVRSFGSPGAAIDVPATQELAEVSSGD